MRVHRYAYNDDSILYHKDSLRGSQPAVTDVGPSYVMTANISTNFDLFLANCKKKRYNYASNYRVTVDKIRRKLYDKSECN